MVDSKSKLPPRHPKSSSLPPSGKKKTKKVKDVSTDVKNDMDHSPIAKTPIKRRKRKNHVKDKKNTTHNSIQNGPFQEKANAILELLQQPEIDLWKLREECFTNGGLINDEIRRKAWPKLVGILQPSSSSTSFSSSSSIYSSHDQLSTISVMDPTSQVKKYQSVAKSLDEHQISLDIARCTWHLLSGSQRARRNAMQNKHKKKMRALLKRKQKRLGNYINLTLIRSYGSEFSFDMNVSEDDFLRYYQGFHDVSCIVLSTLGGDSKLDTILSQSCHEDENNLYEKAIQLSKAMGLDLPSQVLVQLSQSHFKDMMRKNFDYLTKALKLVVFPLILELDWEVHDHLVDCDITPFFCLSWIITWFAHDVRDTPLVKRLFDVFIASHPLMPLYVSVAMVLHPTNRMEILSTECDFASMHKTLTELPKNSSSVGWKFIGTPTGGEYVDEDMDSDTVTLSDDISLISQDVYREECGSLTGEEDDSITPSLANASSLSGMDCSRVPFQELIDLAVVFMRRIPPRSLIKLSRVYYDPKTLKELTNNLDSISLIHDPPEWAVASTAESDDTRMRKRVTGQQNNDHDGNRTTIIKRKGKRTLTKNEMIQYESNYPHAFIASGIGPDGDGDIRRKKRRKKLLRTGSIVIGCAAIVFGFIFSREFVPSSFHSHPTITVEPVKNEMILSSTLEGIRLATVEGLVDIRKDEKVGATEMSSDSDSQEKECQDTTTITAAAATAESMVVAADPNKMHMLQKIVMDHHEVFCGLFCKH